MEEDEFDDWDAEFGFDDGDAYSDDTNTESISLVKGSRIVGITADRFDAVGPNDDWGDDFAIEGDSNSLFSKALRPEVTISLGTSGEVPQLQQEKEDEEAGATATWGDDDDEENWDEEFGIETEDEPETLLQSMLAEDTASPSAESESIPEKYKFLQEKSAIRIVKFPMPTALRTLREKDNHRVFVSDKEMCQWLGAVVSKHKSDVLRNMPNVEVNLDVLVADFKRSLKRLLKPSREWITAQIEFCTALMRRGDKEYCWDHLKEVFDVIRSAHVGDSSIFDDVFVLLHMAAKLFTLEKRAVFEEHCKAVACAVPPRAIICDICVAEAYAHHTEGAEAVQMYIQLYKQLARDSQTPSSVQNEAMCRLLTGFHLFMSGVSPVTTAKHRNFDANEELYYIVSSMGSDEEARTLLETDARMCKLEECYLQLDMSFEKAKSSYALALHANDIGKNHLAERRYFEALYILDECTSKKQLPYIVSEFGSHCLRGFGDVLLYNYKYKYGILAYHECSVNYFLRKRSKEYFHLLKEMASVAVKHDDIKRGVAYYREVLQICIDEGKTNEVIYVSEILSKVYTEIGRFTVAEEFLLGAYSMLGSNDPQCFMLRLKLAQTYMKGFHPERGISLLQSLLDANPPKTKKLQVISGLIKAQMRKRNFHEVRRLLEQYASSDGSAMGHSRKRSQTGGSAVNVSERKGSGSNISVKKKSATYYELESLNYYHAARFVDAIGSINEAIERCSTHNLSALARFFFIRGKIFQSLCADSSSVTFPTTLLPGGAPDDEADATYFRCKGDVIQETIATYRKAYEYFGAVGDEYAVAKTVCRIAETYLESVFPAVGLLQRTFEEVSCHKLFRPTPIVGAPPAADCETEFTVTLAHIAGPATLGLNVATEISDPMLTLRCYLNMAELQFLQGNVTMALSYFHECRTALVTLYVLPLIGKTAAPAQLLRKVYRLLARLVRFMFALDSEVLNKHLFLIDALNEIEVRIANAERRNVPRVSADGSSDLGVTTRIHAMKTPVRMASKTPLMMVYARTHRRVQLPKQSSNRSTRRVVRQSTIRNVRHLFNVEEEVLRSQNVSVGALSGSSSASSEANDGGIEDAAEVVWGCLHCSKALLGKFSDGKQTKDELFNTNQKYLRKILKSFADRFCAYSPLLKPPRSANSEQKEDSVTTLDDVSSECVTYDEMVQTYRRLRRAMYIVKIGLYVCAFVPYTTEKRVRLLGSGEQHESDAAQESDVPASDKGLFFVKVHLTSNGSEQASFSVRRGVTLQALLDFICDLPNSGAALEADVGKKTSKRFFNSFTRNTAKNLKAPTRYLEGSKNFVHEVGVLVSMCDATVETNALTSGTGKSVVSFATKTRQGPDSYLLPMTGSLDRTFEQCFPMEESSPSNPLSLYLFVTSSTPAVCELTNATSELRGDHFGLSEEAISLMTSFMHSTDTTDVANDSYSRVLIEGMLSNCFRWFTGMVPDGGVKCRKKNLQDFPFQEAIRSKGAFKSLPRTPLSLICSKELQAVPWELVFGEMVVRYFCMGHVINREHYLKEEKFVANTLTLPLFHAFCYASYDKQLANQEEARKRHLVDEMKASLHLMPHTHCALSNRNITTPLHNATMRPMKTRPTGKQTKRRKFKMMNSIDLRLYMDNPMGLLMIPEKLRPHEYPVFLLSFADLLEQAEATFEMLCWSIRATFLFVPANAMKEVTGRIMRIQERYAREVDRLGFDLAPNQYQYMMAVISTVQSEVTAPIVIINTP